MKRREGLLSLPSLSWLTLFFIIPAFMVILISFRAVDSYGGILKEWSCNAYLSLDLKVYAPILTRTLRLSILTTLICLIIAIPCAFALSRMGRKQQQLSLLLLLIPFWTNFLIRIFAWKVLLHPDGWIKQVLFSIGLVGADATLLYTEGAVLIVLVYTYLPFAILPLYSSAEKFDYSLFEAARDLGAGMGRIYFHIFLPGIRGGIYSALMVVFIPALGSYIIPEIMGGPNSDMLGNKIAQRVFVDRNLPRAGALSSLMIMVILLPSVLSLIKRNGSRFVEGGAGE